MRAKTIDDVLKILAAIVADTKARQDPLGYFAALYRQVTLEVKAGIERGFFDDGQRLSRFAASFANAYLYPSADSVSGCSSAAGPASSNSTRTPDCSASLPATTHPAEPPPTTT